MRKRVPASKGNFIKEIKDKELIEKYNKSRLSKIEKPFRLIFYIQVFIALTGFLFTPFSQIETIQKYKYRVETIKRGGKLYYGDIKTDSGKEIQLASIRLKSAQIAKGDSIYILKNLLYKTEGIKHINSDKTYFIMKKWTWCFIWFFALTTGIVSTFFKSPQDLYKRGIISVFLFILTFLYMVI